MEPTVSASPGQFSTLITMNVTSSLNCSPLWTADTITTSFCKFKVTMDVYLVTTLCMLGIVANVFSAIVLRHAKAMRSTTRYLLQMLAVSDSLYLVTCLGHQTLGTLEECTSWGRNNLDLVWAHAKPPTFVLSNVAQTVSVWLVVCVTADRWLIVTYPLRAARLSTVARARRVVLAVWLVAVAYNVPRLFERQVVEVYDEMAGRTRWSATPTTLRVHPVYVVLYDTALFFLLRFFLPLFLLTFFNVRLLCTVRRSRRLAQTLATSSRTPSHHRRRANDTNNSTGAGGGDSSERAQHVQQPHQQQQHLSSDSKHLQCSQQQQCEQRNIQCCRDIKLQKHRCDSKWQQHQRLTNDNENLQLLQQQCSPAVPCDIDSECVPLQYHQQCPSDSVLSSHQQQQYSSDTSEQPLHHLHSCQPCVTRSDGTQQQQQQQQQENNTHHSPNDSTSTPLHQHAQPKSDNKRSPNSSASKSERAVLTQHQMSGSQKRDNQQQQKQKQCGGQTQMLVVVVVVFFICELPDFLLRTYMSVYAVRSVIDPGFKDVYVECYRPLLRYANVFSNFSLTFNSSINFAIYVLVSRHFRLVMVAILLGHKHKLRELVTHIN